MGVGETPFNPGQKVTTKIQTLEDQHLSRAGLPRDWNWGQGLEGHRGSAARLAEPGSRQVADAHGLREMGPSQP